MYRVSRFLIYGIGSGIEVRGVPANRVAKGHQRLVQCGQSAPERVGRIAGVGQGRLRRGVHVGRRDPGGRRVGLGVGDGRTEQCGAAIEHRLLPETGTPAQGGAFEPVGRVVEATCLERTDSEVVEHGGVDILAIGEGLQDPFRGLEVAPLEMIPGLGDLPLPWRRGGLDRG